MVPDMAKSLPPDERKRLPTPKKSPAPPGPSALMQINSRRSDVRYSRPWPRTNISPMARIRLQWILNYCTAHPHEKLLSAALAFRDDLIARGMFK